MRTADLSPSAKQEARMVDGDLERVEAGTALCHAFHRQRRDAADETHNCPSAKPSKSA